MDKKELIKQCRYYHGEGECPNAEYSLLWDYERFWVDCLSKGAKIYDTDAEEMYNLYGLKDFCINDGVPKSLKVLLFTRYLHWCGGYGVDIDSAGFREFYHKDYLKG